MKYTVKDLRVDFPDEDACLEWLIDWLYPDGVTCKKCDRVTKHYKDKNRRSYSCSECGHHMHPTAGTVFHNSHVPLSLWYHAFYMLSTNKAGTSAAQIQRELGVTYKTAWRMMHQIRHLMGSDEQQLSGEVEIDETFLHANVYKRSSARMRYGPTGTKQGDILFGIVQRGGPVKVLHVPTIGTRVLLPIIQKHVRPSTLIHTDGYKPYRLLPKLGYEHRWTDHSKLEFYREDSYTQNIENVWSHLKRGIKGVYRHVSSKHLQLYANEYAWRYSHRNDVSMFWSLMGRISGSDTPIDL
jgi:transposase